MPKVVRAKTATRAQLRGGPYSARNQKSTKCNPKKQIPQITAARPFTAIERSRFRSDLNSPLTKFELFPYLPLELRLPIWDLARPESRRIDVLYKEDGRTKEHVFRGDVPTLLRVCRESRREMKKWYKCAFKHPRAINICYFDFDRDVLFLSKYMALDQMYDFVLRSESPEDFNDVQRLAIDRRKLDKMVRHGPANKVDNLFSRFQGLKEMIVVESENLCTHAENRGPHSIDGFRDKDWGGVSQSRFERELALFRCEPESDMSFTLKYYKGLSLNLLTRWPATVVFTHKDSCKWGRVYLPSDIWFWRSPDPCHRPPSRKKQS